MMEGWGGGGGYTMIPSSSTHLIGTTSSYSFGPSQGKYWRWGGGDDDRGCDTWDRDNGAAIAILFLRLYISYVQCVNLRPYCMELL